MDTQTGLKQIANKFHSGSIKIFKYFCTLQAWINIGINKTYNILLKFEFLENNMYNGTWTSLYYVLRQDITFHNQILWFHFHIATNNIQTKQSRIFYDKRYIAWALIHRPPVYMYVVTVIASEVLSFYLSLVKRSYKLWSWLIYIVLIIVIAFQSFCVCILHAGNLYNHDGNFFNC